ncbi:MAG: hypothetical protein IKD25_00695, partial [Bacteroidaceae bacterium]|nr:hypothetical protein [Bacteroidaceae bacterium]
MKRLKVNRKGTHKMAENQKGSKHSTKPITEEEKKCLYIHSETILTPLLIAVPHSDEEQDGSAGRGSGTAPGRARDRPETRMRTEAGTGQGEGTEAGTGTGNRNWQHTKKRGASAASFRCGGSIEEGGDLLSRIAVQYHRRA